MKKMLPHFLGFAFCCVLSGVVYFGFAVLADHGISASAWQPAFYSFLPMTFFFVGVNTLRMQKELDELREKVSDLELAAQAKQLLKP